MNKEVSKEDVTFDVTRHRAALVDAYKEYWRHLDQLEGQQHPFPFDITARLESAPMRLLDGQLLVSDIRELINNYNAWQDRLYAWHAWNAVSIAASSEQLSWDIRWKFSEPLAFFCLHMPSAFRDSLMTFCSLAMHLGLLNRDNTHKDELEQDREVFRRLQNGSVDAHKYFLPRKKAFEQLRQLSGKWGGTTHLIQLLEKIDSDSYRSSTLDWRNSSSHYIGPRLEYGETRFVKRYVCFGQEKIDLGDGSFQFQDNPEKMQIAYGFGGTPALPMAEVANCNREQLDLARQALMETVRVLEEICFESEHRKTN